MPDQATADLPAKPDQGLPPSLIAPKGPLYQAGVGPLDSASPDLSAPIQSMPRSGGQDTVTRPGSGFSSGTNKPILTTWQSTADWWASNSEAPRHVAEGIADVVNGESGFQVNNITQDKGGPSGGLYQAHLDRLTNLQSQQNWDLDPNIQHKWALQQLYGGDPIATAHRNEIFSAKTREEAKELFSRYFERPAGTQLANTQAGDLSTYQKSQAQAGDLIRQRQEALGALLSRLGGGQGDSQERRKLLQESLDRSRELQEHMFELARNPPTQKPTDLMSAFGSLAMLIGAIGGLKSRQPATAALQAAAGVIEGVQANNHEEYERNFKTWQSQSKLLEELTGVQAQDFRMILENDRLDEAERHNQLQETLEKWGMQDSLLKLQLGQLEEAWKGPLNLMQVNAQLEHLNAQTTEAYARAAKDMQLAAGGGKTEQFVDTGTLDPQGNPTPYIRDQSGNTFKVEMQLDENGQTHQVRIPYTPVSPGKVPTTSAATSKETELTKNLEAARASGDKEQIKTAEQAIKDFNEARGKGQRRYGAQAMIMQKFFDENPEATFREAENAMGEYRRIQALEGGFASGQLGQNIVRLNTVADHILLVKEYFEDLKNGQIPRANQVANVIAKETGQPEVTNFNAGRTIMADEIVRLLTSTGGTEQDRKDMNAALPNFSSPAQGEGVINVFNRFVHGRFEALQQQYAQGDPSREKRFHDELLTDKSRRLFADASTANSGGRKDSLDATREQYDKLPSGAAYTVPGDPTVRYKQ